ncbi:unnamed protein product [Gongylonema pulchrum]|uniref:UV excision repair protein RAD23 n=1 Tax=Gongylonema pulchrum TaxID=637853 RepID=A0A183E708_9BILA|nr:unnamed protein product [Gongylonema pulchrum]
MIAEVKAKIAQEKGESEYPVECQKLIYNGKVLDDAQTVEEVKIDTAKFVVIMITRQPAATDANTATAATESAPAAAAAQNPELTAEQEETVQAIVAMGYPRDRVIRALRASFFNGDRAVEYLCSGIPEDEGFEGSLFCL